MLVARSGVLMLPKLLLGIPFTDITNMLQKDWIPEWLRARLVRFMTWIVHGDMTKLGFKPLNARAHVTSNATVVNHIAYRRIVVKQGIEKIDGKRIHFADGSAEEFDTLIAATGYLIDLPFLSPDIVPVEDNSVDLYQRIVPPGWPGLYFMGMFNTNTALNMIYEYQARWIREIELGNAALPPAPEMRAAIEDRKRWVRGDLQGLAPPYDRRGSRSLPQGSPAIAAPDAEAGCRISSHGPQKPGAPSVIPADFGAKGL